MRVLFYLLAIAAASLGFVGLFRATENALEGNGLDIARFVVGVVGLMLAFLCAKSARSFGKGPSF